MDTIANMLIKMKNGNNARHEAIVVPSSKTKRAILECLKKEGFVKAIADKTEKGHPILEVELIYKEDGTPRISDVVRVSKPSRRMYMSVKEIRPVKNGAGVVVLSTPKGILSGRDARKEMVGGEVLFNIW